MKRMISTLKRPGLVALLALAGGLFLTSPQYQQSKIRRRFILESTTSLTLALSPIQLAVAVRDGFMIPLTKF